MRTLQKIILKINKIKKLTDKKGVSNSLKLLMRTISKKFKLTAHRKTLEVKTEIFRNNNINQMAEELKKTILKGILRNPVDIINDIKALHGSEVQSIINISDNILKYEFQIYGHLKIDFKSKQISLLKDPITNYKWTHECNSYYVRDDKYIGTDIKTIWEIARFQFLSALSIAYIITGKDKYSYCAIEHIKTWIDENIFLKGPHWMIAMESSIRLINWCIYLPLLDFYEGADQHTIKKLTKSIIEHLVFIRENLEYSLFKENNHYLSNIVGLLTARLLFPSQRWANAYTEFAIKEFNKEVLSQFDESGINFEGSLAYHRLSSEICIAGIELVKKNNVELPYKVKNRINSIANFTRISTGLSDEIPVIGDNDSGILLDLFPGKTSNDHAYLNLLFRIALNKEGYAKNYTEKVRSIPFKKITFTRNNDARKNNYYEKSSQLNAKNYNGLIIGYKDYEGFFFNTFHSSHGHTHNDKLSIFPVIKKKHLFVDRGSYSYTGFIKKRNIDRKTITHNGPVINGWEQNRIWEEDVFYTNEDAKCDSSIVFKDKVLRIVGWHDGYKRFRSGMKVYRQIDWDTINKKMVISDWIDSKNIDEKYCFAWNFLINPIWKIKEKDDIISFSNGKTEITCQISDNIGLKIKETSYCPNYMQEVYCLALKGIGTGTANERFEFRLHY
jgi:hypothetical protein